MKPGQGIMRRESSFIKAAGFRTRPRRTFASMDKPPPKAPVPSIRPSLLIVMRLSDPRLQHALSVALAVPDLPDLTELWSWAARDGDAAPESCPGISKELRDRLQDLHRTGSVVEELRRAELLSLELIAWTEDHYPAALRDLRAPPPVLYLRGRGPWPPVEPVTIVGARRSTLSGRDFAARLGEDVVLRGASVLSGLALGIDQAALAGALRGGGNVYAVLACGVDRVYPPGAERMARDILERGRLISEMPLGIPPLRHHFPRRNRILAAFPRAVLIVEADLRSGSLITAGHALELGREVFAVPGSIDQPTSRGTNRLIRDGAQPLLECEDLDFLLPPRPRLKSNDALLACLKSPRTAEDAAKELSRPMDEILLRLVDLELDGKVERLGVGLYRARS